MTLARKPTIKIATKGRRRRTISRHLLTQTKSRQVYNRPRVVNAAILSVYQ